MKAQVLEALTDPKILLLALISFVNAVASGGLSFGSIIIKGFGFTSLQTTLMNMPLSFLQAVFTLMGGYAQHKFPNARLIVGSVAMIPPIIGTVLINQLDVHNKWGRLVGVWLLAGYPTGFMVLLGLLATNVTGTTKKSMASAMVFVMYCVGQIVGTYPSTPLSFLVTDTSRPPMLQSQAGTIVSWWYCRYADRIHPQYCFQSDPSNLVRHREQEARQGVGGEERGGD